LGLPAALQIVPNNLVNHSATLPKLLFFDYFSPNSRGGNNTHPIGALKEPIPKKLKKMRKLRLF